MPRKTPPSPAVLRRLDRAMKRAGFEPVYDVQPHERESLALELVDMSAIAERAGTTLGTVKSWRNRHPDFPAPLVTLAIGPVFAWTDVGPWIAARARRRPAAVPEELAHPFAAQGFEVRGLCADCGLAESAHSPAR